MQQLINYIKELELQRQAIDAAHLSQAAQKEQQETLELAIELQREYEDLENELEHAWNAYHIAATNEVEAAQNRPVLDKITGNDETVKKLNKEARRLMKRINELEEQKRELALSLENMEIAPSSPAAVTYQDELAPHIEHAKAELQQLQNEYALVHNQLPPVINTPALEEAEEAEEEFDLELDLPVTPQAVAAPEEVLEEELVVELPFAPKPTMENRPAHDDVNYFDAEHILAAKQKIRDELGPDCDIPENCDLTLNQLVDGLYKNKMQAQPEPAAQPQAIPTPKPTPANTAKKAEATEEETYKKSPRSFGGAAILGLFVEVKSFVGLRLAQHGNQFVLEMCQFQVAKVQVLALTQDKNGNLNLGYASAFYGQFGSQTFFGNDFQAKKPAAIGADYSERVLPTAIRNRG